MKKIPLVMVFCLCGAGLLVGLAARRLTTGPPPVVVTRVMERSETSSPKAVVATAPPVSQSRSADTLETLAGLPHVELYSRLAAWLVDASGPEIAAYWEGYRKKEFSEDFDDTDSIPELVFINWIRVDRSAAMTAAAGTPAEEQAWAAWACHDPQGSLAAALVAGPEHVGNVAYWLGEYQPAWLRQHFNEIPEAARERALVGLLGTGDAQNPLEMLKFAKEHGIDSEDSTFKALVNKDPWAALNWAKENRTGLDTLVSQMAEERPDDLVRLAAQSPSGEAKRMMEAALFANLFKTDPEAAIAQTKAEAPKVAAERFTALGLALVKTDPGQAFEMAELLMAAYPDAMLETTNLIQIPGGQLGGLETSLDGVTELMDSLLVADPARLMDLLAVGSPWFPFDKLCEKWIRRDMAAYAEWVKRQKDPVVYDEVADKIVARLSHDEQFRDAADWAMTLSSENRYASLKRLAVAWAWKDRAKALEWLQSAELSAEQKSYLRDGIGQ